VSAVQAWLAGYITWTLATLLLGTVVIMGYLTFNTLFLIWLERKVSGHIQRRYGPMEVGPHGALQTVADMLKLLGKQLLTPVAVDRYRVFARYRRDFFRRWIFVELEPELGWPWSVDRGRHREIAGTVRLEVQFQGQDPSEAASSHAQDVAEPTTTSPVARPR